MPTRATVPPMSQTCSAALYAPCANRRPVSASVFRRPGYRRGIVLGQPRGDSWAADPKARDMREHVLSGEFDTADAEAQIRAEIAGEAVFCPRCAPAPTATRTGLCAVCHARALADKHRDAIS